MTAALLDVRDVVIRFGGVRALDGVSLAVQEKSIHGLIGPNGAGKTTLLNVVSRIFAPDSGALHYRGRNLLQTPAQALQKLGMSRTFQNLALIDDATALDNVLVGLHVHRPGGLIEELILIRRGQRHERESRELAYEALDTVGLAAYAAVPVSRLSYGQRKMVELARAWVGQPRLLLLDEPTAGLNGGEIESLRQTLLRVRSALGLTVLVITHHIEFLVDMADAVTVLDLGRTIAAGSIDAVRNDPRVIDAYLGSAL